MMITKLLLTALGLLIQSALPGAPLPKPKLFPASDSRIQYTGRVDFADPQRPRFWAPGVYITVRFAGPTCDILIDDEVLGGTNHNYLEIIVDGKYARRKLGGKSNVIRVAEGLSNSAHVLTICKATEAGIGYLEFKGLRCARLLPPLPKPVRRIEFVGNSITCGMGAVLAPIPCDSGQWYDQHSAYLAYGPTVARALSAQWHLTAVSGIGLMRSCCDKPIIMPAVFDKLNLEAGTGTWDFTRYQPDVVTVCLGQNDGVQDSTQFCNKYGAFLRTVRQQYPRAAIVCLTSPMGDAKLTAALKNYLTSIVATAHARGDRDVYKFFFARRYVGGCGSHPTQAEQASIAAELIPYLRTTLKW